MKIILSSVFTLLLSTSAWAAAQQAKIDGLWEARYDASNTPSSHIRITTQPNGELVGVIEAAYPRPGQNPPDICTECTGENKDKPIIGLKVLWGMKPSGNNQWDSGHVLDAETGSIYSGKMELKGDGSTLDLRGYVLHPIFGETATWHRIK